MISKRSVLIMIISIGLLMAGFIIRATAQEEGPPGSAIPAPEVKPEAASETTFKVKVKVGPEEIPATESELSPEKELAPGHITMDFKDADIRSVLRAISYKSGINIIAGPEVEGAVTVRLVNVPWEKALEVILNTYDFGCERDGNIITVTTLKKLTDKRKEEQELAGVEPIKTKVFKLKYVDAGDVAALLKDQVSERGVITVLEEKGQKGWAFGADEFKKRQRLVAKEGQVKSKTLVISDIPSYLERIEKIIAEIDVLPRQILIETKLVEVNNDKLVDLGIEIGSGSNGWTGVGVKEGGGRITSETNPLEVKPSNFNPKSTTLVDHAGSWADTGFTGGLTFMYQKLLGSQMRVILHALEEDVDTNILSAPQITTLNNQEAAIMVGMKYPILKGEVEEGVLTTSLDYYQDIGIQLNVIPQISGDNQINMIVHPSVTSYTTTVDAHSVDEDDHIVVIAEYPVILTREAETQVLINDGDAIVIGGLMKDVKTESVIGVPFLQDIPILGLLFKRTTVDVEKIDLLIFISAHIVGPDTYVLSGGNVQQVPPPAEVISQKNK